MEIKLYKVGVCAALLAIVGCGSRDSLQLAPVYGTVTYKGKPLDHGQVIFSPEAGGGAIAVGSGISADGSYDIRTGSRQGAPLGKYIVRVDCRHKADHNSGRELLHPLPPLIPEKYGSQESPLHFEVKAGKNFFPITIE